MRSILFRETVCNTTHGLCVSSHSVGIELAPQVVGSVIPRPTHIQGQLGQGIESLDFRGQQAVSRVADTCWFTHGFSFFTGHCPAGGHSGAMCRKNHCFTPSTASR